MSGSETLALDPTRVRTLVQDALAELEVWRQHAREPQEWTALRRLATALDLAQRELYGESAVAAHGMREGQGELLG